MRADLYIRVSTDEQADKGYSQRDQEERLRKYCELQRITIRKVILEDHSAKTFNRPEWSNLLADLKKRKNQVDLILFTKWDRFSRNTGDAYHMINVLRKLGVEPQAIEQPLDLSIPENKMMLAFYLAAPEVENDRRALNVIYGMRRAKKEGRYMGLAPVGYINKTDENGRAYIAIQEPQASILRWAFEEIAKETYNTEQVFKMAKEKGFRGVKTLFWSAIRNPVYCGKIFVAKYKDEESCYVKSLHEPIISEDLFYRVQDVLDGRTRHFRLKVIASEDLPLRGFLICPKCGKILTGSSSKGRTKHYAYYHCFLGCKFRHRADDVNNQFMDNLRQYIPRAEMADVYKIVLQQSWRSQTGHLQDERKKILKEIQVLEEKIAYIRELLSSRKIEPEDFREMKSDYNSKLERLEARLSATTDDSTDIQGLLTKGIDNLLKLDKTYEKADMEKKREIISSMYPEKMHFENNQLRTGRVNEAVRFIYMIDSKLGGNKKGQTRSLSDLSSQVGKTGFEPATPWSQTRCATGLRYFPNPVI